MELLPASAVYLRGMNARHSLVRKSAQQTPGTLLSHFPGANTAGDCHSSSASKLSLAFMKVTAEAAPALYF